MQQSPPQRRETGALSGAFAFEAKLQDEDQLLDAMLTAMVRGSLPADAWDNLHAAARRDGRLHDLAFAFESTSQGKRLKVMQPAVAAEFLFQAARFASDVFDDDAGAMVYLERALGLAPTHGPSFERIERVLKKLGLSHKLADVYATTAQHRPRAEQATWLRRAVHLLMDAVDAEGSTNPGNKDERLVELLQQILRLQPGDEDSRSRLESLYVKGNRLRDIIRLNEQALAAEPGPEVALRTALLARIVELYDGKLQEPEKSLPHVEQLLAVDPANERGRRVANTLLAVRGLAGRAAAALGAAYEVHGTAQEVVRFLTIELENTRGPKRASLLARLGWLRHERMGDDKGAFEALEQSIALDATADEARDRYLFLATRLERWADAAKTFGRVVSSAADPAVKAKASAQMAEMLLRGGDARRARAILTDVLGAERTPPEAALAAARVLRGILEGDRDRRALCDVLEKLALLETDEDRRREADERLAEQASKLPDMPRAIAAYERLLETSGRARALEALEPLYKASGDPAKLARLLEERARDVTDAAVARDALVRAAQIRIKETKDVSAAIATCRTIIDRFGPAPDVLAMLVPMLEAEGRWKELAEATAQEASLTSGPARAQAMARLGTLRLTRVRDVLGAIEAFGEAVAIEPTDKTSRATLEKLATAGEGRLAAARVLEPVYRMERAAAPLLKILELRGSLEPKAEDRLEAWRDMADLAVTLGAREAGRGVEAVARGLAEAAASGRPLRPWLDRLVVIAAPAADPKRFAAILASAIGDLAVTSEELRDLASLAAEAQADCGEARSAVELYRRALAFEPQATEVEAHRPVRRELLHRIARLEQEALGDLDSAVAAYRMALEDDAGDAEATAALADLYAQAERWGDLYALLDARAALAEGEEVRDTRARLAELAASHGDEARAREQCERLLEDSQLTSVHLEAVERAAERVGDFDVVSAALRRRADRTPDAQERIHWLDRLGRVDAEHRGDPEGAAVAWTHAAALAESVGEDAVARRLLARARAVASENVELTERLVALCERSGSWGDLPELYESLAERTADQAARVDLWLRAARVLSEKLGDPKGAAHRAEWAFRADPSAPAVLAAFERLSVEADAIADFERVVRDALARWPDDDAASAPGRTRLLLSSLRIAAADPARADDTALTCRSMMTDARVDGAVHAEILTILDALIAADPSSPRRREDKRWALQWSAENAPDQERVARMLEWAHAEEAAFDDSAQALVLYRRVLALDPYCEDALAGVARLALASGDVDEALAALRGQRARAEAGARTAIELQIAQVLLAHTTQWREALDSLQVVLRDAPSDPSARALAAQLLAHRGTRDNAIAMLEQACEGSSDPDVRGEVLGHLLNAPADPSDGDARRRWFEKLCDLRREQGDVEGALATAIRAAGELPDTEAFWDRAEELARAVGRPDDVAALYEDVLSRSLALRHVSTIGERAVQFYEEWFEDPSRVARVLERVLELDPAADWAFDRLKLIFDAAERWDELFALYDRALASATGRRRTALLEDATQTAKDFADRPDRAIRYLEELHREKPRDSKLGGALERLYEREGRYRDLVTLLGERIPSLKGDDAERTRTRIAGLCLDQLDDPGAALAAIEPSLAGGSGVSDGSEMWALLERIVGDVPRTAADAPAERDSARQRAAALLRDRYARLGRERDLARMLLVELEAVTSSSERVRRHGIIADLLEKTGDLAGAFEQVGLAVVLDPGDETRRSRLVSLAEGAGMMARLADVLVGAAAACESEVLRVGLTMQAAAVRAERIEDPAGAIALLLGVLSGRDATQRDALAAARLLDPLLEGAGRAEERLDVLERIVELEDADGRREALGRAARLAAQIGKDERAVAAWEKRIAMDQGDTEALDGLVDLLERQGRSDRLTEVLALRASVGGDLERQRADRVWRARLLAEPLRRAADAIDAWYALERDFGNADDAAIALTELLRDEHRWEELSRMLARRAGDASNEPTRAELLRQLGDLRREVLGDGVGAVETYARALAADPRNEGARQGLLVLAQDDAHRASAVPALLEPLRSCDDWRAILELTPHRLAAAGHRMEQRDVLAEVARIHEERAGDAGLAFEAMRRAFALDPGDPTIEQELVRLAGAASAWRRLVESYVDAIAASIGQDVALVVALRTKAAVVLETRLDDPAAALSHYLEVLRESADTNAGKAAVRLAAAVLAHWDVAAGVVADLARVHDVGVSALLDVYEEAARNSDAWEPAARALSAAVAASELGGGVARDLEARAARWHLEQRMDADAAESALQRALVHDPANPELLSELARLQRRARERPLVDTLQRLSRATGGDMALLREAVEVARDSIGDRTLARSLLAELVAVAHARLAPGGDEAVALEDPGGLAACAEWAVRSLARLLEEDGDVREVVDLLVDADALPLEVQVRRDMRRRAARISLDRLNDEERGIALYAHLFAEDAHDEEAVDRLAAAYAARGQLQELLDLRERQLAATTEGEKRAALREEMARLLVDLGDGQRAADVLRATLLEDPRHPSTVEALAVLLEREVRIRELSEHLASQAGLSEQAGDGPRAAELWARAAEIADQRLKDSALAETYHARVAALEPRWRSLDALARLTLARGDAAAAAAWLDRLVAVAPPDRRVEAIVRLADALTLAGEPGRASERLERALAEAPEAELLRERLATLYRERGEWSLLARCLADGASYAPDKATRMARLLEAADLLSERCARGADAVPLYEQASALTPEDPSVRLRLAGALAGAQRFDDARGILHSMIASFGGRRPKERAPVHYQVARLELAMGNRARAIQELDTAARVDPQNAETLRTLAELARDDGQLDRAEKSYRALLVVLRRRQEPGDSQGIARSEVLLELSEIARLQGEGGRAGEILESALEAASSSDFEHERLEKVLRARGDHATLVRALEAKLARLGASPPAAVVCTELARVLLESLGRPEEALSVLLRALAADPRSASAHEAALALARTHGAVERYVDRMSEWVEGAVARGDVSLACTLLVRLGEAVEKDLGAVARSAALLERAMELGLRSSDLLRSLDRIYERLGDVPNRARVLSMRIEADAIEGGPGAASQAMYALAALRLSSVGTLDDGVQILRSALDLDPRFDRAAEFLAKAAALDPTNRRVLELYEAVARQPGQERALVEALGLRSQLAGGGDVDALREAVEVAVRIGDVALAESLLRFFDAQESTTQNGALRAWAMSAVASLHERAGDARRAVELKRAAARLADPEVARELRFEVAAIAERAGDLALAAEAYEGLHAADPADREAWEPLANVYRRAGEWRKLAELIQRVVETVDDASERGRLRFERVRALMQGQGLEDRDAVPLLREIVDEDSGQVEAALTLASILERQGASSELAELLARQLEAAKDRADGPSVASLALRLGRLIAATDHVEARNTYYAGLDWDATSRELLDALLDLLEGDDDEGERADVAERRLALEHGPQAEEMALTLSSTRTQLGDEAGAERALELGFRGYPASMALRELLESRYRSRGEWRKLAELFVLDGGARTSPAERVDRLREAAAIWRHQLSDAKSAASVLGQARSAAPQDATLIKDHVEMLVEAGDDAGAAAELDAAIAPIPDGDARRAPLQAARAQIRARAGDQAGALADLEQAFLLDGPTYATPLAAQLQRSHAAAVARGDADAARALRLTEAQVLASSGDTDGARRILTHLVEHDASDRDALRALAELCERLGDWEGTASTLQRVVVLEDGALGVATSLRFADACERVGRVGDARGALERARKMAPDDRAVRQRLERVYEETASWKDLVALALEDAHSSSDASEQFDHLLRASSLLLAHEEQASAAVPHLEEALALRPSHPECVALLADALTRSGRAPEARALLEDLLAPHSGRRVRELAALYWRAACVARELDDAAGEMQALVHALESDSQNGSVCADVALRAIEIDELELANRALRAVTLLKTPGPMSRALAYQYMGDIAHRQGDPKRALVLLKRALTEDPSLEGARALVGVVEGR
jgi:thioredoxin-like negative regulator of GroEL